MIAVVGGGDWGFMGGKLYSFSEGELKAMCDNFDISYGDHNRQALIRLLQERVGVPQADKCGECLAPHDKCVCDFVTGETGGAAQWVYEVEPLPPRGLLQPTGFGGPSLEEIRAKEESGKPPHLRSGAISKRKMGKLSQDRLKRLLRTVPLRPQPPRVASAIEEGVLTGDVLGPSPSTQLVHPSHMKAIRDAGGDTVHNPDQIPPPT